MRREAFVAWGCGRSGATAMMRTYLAEGSRVARLDEPLAQVPSGAVVVWVDLVAPTDAEIAAVANRFGVALPERAKLRTFAASMRTMVGRDFVMMTLRALSREGEVATSHPVSCILRGELLVTVRQHPALGFDAVHDMLPQLEGGEINGRDVFFAIVEANIDRITDRLETLGKQIDHILHEVFTADSRGPRRSSRRDRRLMRSLGDHGSHTLRVEDSLMSLERLALFLAQNARLVGPEADERDRIAAIGADARSLSEYARSLDEKVGFLLDASLGIVQLEQNEIMKTITILAAMFLPGTLIASIFGMNFRDMPPLSWRHGFGVTLFVMFAASVAMAMIFRWRRWL